ncbi:MAG TPA: carboxypeptidase regulatory-like domain-containing protein [Gemmatimonadaceae bacterium]|jgi:hypothetical protein|nr:carboxypeptidase regulatory-like domain-containing protein [Gemmatimonadaceae bacterium]
MRTVSVLFLSCAALASVSLLQAQSNSLAGTVPNARPQALPIGFEVSGTVADQDGNAIVGAEVAMVKQDAAPRGVRRVRSDSAGHFTLNDLPNSALTLRVRRMGYAPRELDVRIPARSRATTVLVTLDPMAAEIDGMSVNDTLRDHDERLRAFDERRATNDFAHFVDADAIARRRPQYISEMLRTVPGVSVSPSRLGYSVKLRGCAPLVWVDGVRIPGVQLDDVARPADIAGLEIYNSFAGIPAQYFDRSATCGTILVWTRAR